MDNLILISTIFLVAALNSFIIVLVVRFILKIRTEKPNVAGELRKEVVPVVPKPQVSEQKKISLQEEKVIKQKIEEKKKQVEKAEKPRYLKYTVNGYIKPENDIKKKHLWR